MFSLGKVYITTDALYIKRNIILAKLCTFITDMSKTDSLDLNAFKRE